MKIELTDSEIIMIQEALHAFDPTGTGWEQTDINELADDIREQDCRRDDDWNDSVTHDMETRMFNAGVKAREKMMIASAIAIEKMKEATDRAGTNASKAQDRRQTQQQKPRLDGDGR
jgi:hypothetical protein